MTALELINELKKLKPDTEIFTYDQENDDYDDITGVKMFPLRKKKACITPCRFPVKYRGA